MPNRPWTVGPRGPLSTTPPSLVESARHRHALVNLLHREGMRGLLKPRKMSNAKRKCNFISFIFYFYFFYDRGGKIHRSPPRLPGSYSEKCSHVIFFLSLGGGFIRGKRANNSYPWEQKVYCQYRGKKQCVFLCFM